jgi:hypothetical protein
MHPPINPTRSFSTGWKVFETLSQPLLQGPHFPEKPTNVVNFIGKPDRPLLGYQGFSNQAHQVLFTGLLQEPL